MTGKKIGLLAAVLVVPIAGYLIWALNDRCSGAGGAPGCASGEIELLGNVDIRQVTLAFKVAGRIEEVLVEEGDSVSKGTPVARLEKADFEDDLRLAEAKLAATTANVTRLEKGSRPEEIQQAKDLVAERKATAENAVRNLRRREKLADQGFTAHEAHEDAEAFLNEARARLNAAEQALALAVAGPRIEDIEIARAERMAAAASRALTARREADAILYAPNDGVILTRVREPGAIVGVGEPILNLSLSSPVWVRTYVDEPDLGRISAGMTATVTTDSGRTYTGQVGFISPVAEFTPKAVETRELRTSLVYRIRVIIPSPDDGLKQGMPVTVTVPVAQKP